MQLAQLTDQDLLDSLASLVMQEKQCLAAVIDHLAEVDARAAYRPWASSLFVYATLHLHLSEASAYKRITAARLVRRFRCVLDALHRGDVHLSALSILSPHLTDANCAELLLAARHKTTRAVEVLVAERFPKADVAQLIRKLPEHSPQGEFLPTTQPLPSLPQSLALTMATPASVDNPRVTGEARPHQVPSQSRGAGLASVGPLAADRYKVQFTASKQLHDKLRVAQQLLSHRIPKGDVAAVLEAALDHLIDDVMHERFATPRRRSKATQHSPARTDAGVDKHDPPCDRCGNPALSASTPDAPSATTTCDPAPAPARRRYIPAAIRRQVIERDGLRCTHLDPQGQRCTETHLLELHHLEPFARGGGHDVANLTLRCNAHNRYAAERDYGTELIRQRISARQSTDPRVQHGV